MDSKNRLGRGLASIFNTQTKLNNITELSLDLITRNPYQPRSNFSNNEIKELASSIKTYGLIQPITVRKSNQNKYELISGERRLLAVKSIGIKKIPVFIKNVQDKNMLAIALVENIQRENLDPIDIAISFKNLIFDHNMSHEKLGKKLGKSRSSISNYIRLLKLDPIVQAGLRDKIISLGHAKAMINVTNHEEQLEIYKLIVEQNLTVRETEKISRHKNIRTKKTSKTLNINLSNNFLKMENNLSTFFNKKVSLRIKKNGSGRIEIPFNNEKNLNEIIKILYSS